MASSQEVFSLIEWFMARYPNSNWPDATGRAWAEDLAEFPITDLQAAAIMWHRQAHEWPPNAGQLMASALDLAAGPESDWESGWQAVMAHMKACRFPPGQCGHDKTEIFDGPTCAAVSTIGWYTLCMSDLSNMPTIRAQFRDVYRTTAKRQREADRTPDAVTALLEASRPAQIAPPPRAQVVVIDTPHADTTGIRPAPQNWKTETGSRRAELDAIIRRKGSAL